VAVVLGTIVAAGVAGFIAGFAACWAGFFGGSFAFTVVKGNNNGGMDGLGWGILGAMILAPLVGITVAVLIIRTLWRNETKQ